MECYFCLPRRGAKMIVQINSISSETPTSDYIMVKDGQPEISSGELGTPPTATKSFGSRVLNPGFSLEPALPVTGLTVYPFRLDTF